MTTPNCTGYFGRGVLTLGRATGWRRALWLVALAALLPLAVAAPAIAQDDEDDWFAEVFFDPELVMQNRQQIGLTDAQWDRISSELRELQRSAVDYEWDMADAAQDLMAIARTDAVDEAAAIDAARRIFAVENEIKIIQMQMVIRIKNVLTPQQQAALRNIRGGM